MTKLTSDTIRELRLPLALMVVLVHVYGFWGNGDPAGFVLGGSESGSGSFVFDIIRTVVSYGLCTFAVPCFFLIAGYLFFVREEKPTMPFYGRQWCKRLFSILIPYLAWNLIAIFYDASKLLWDVYREAESSGAWSVFFDRIISPDIFWAIREWGGGQTNIFGQILPVMTGPYCVPLWFLRDLMVVVLLSPILAWLIRGSRGVVLLLFAFLSVCPVSLGFYCPLPALFFFSIGIWFAFEKKPLAETMLSLLPYMLAGVVVFGAAYFVFASSAPAVSLIVSKLFCFCGVGLCFGLTARLVRRHPSDDGAIEKRGFLSRFYRYASANTMYIYIAHSIVGLPLFHILLFRVLEPCIPQNVFVLTLEYFFAGFCGVVFTLASLYVMEKMMPRTISILIGRYRPKRLR